MKVLIIIGAVAALQAFCLLASPTTLQSSKGKKIDRIQLIIEEEIFDGGDDYDNDNISDNEIIIRDAITQALEDLRTGMTNGFPDLGVPPLDPLAIPDIPFNINWDNNTVYGNLTDSELVNLSNFVLSKIFVHIQFALLVDFGLETENWELHGSYSMGGQALGVDVVGGGNYHITLNDVRFAFSVIFGLSSWLKYIEIKDLSLDLMMTNADVQFEHLLGGGITGALINEALSAEMPIVLKVLEDILMPPLVATLKNKTNEYLMNFPIYPDFNLTSVDYWDEGF